MALLWGFFGAGCGGGEESTPDETTWRVVEDGHRDGLLLSVWGRGPNDLWAVGGRGDRTLVLRGGPRLTQIEAPGGAAAWWVCGLGSEGVAVVGADGLVLVDTGEGLVPHDLGVTGTLYGCWGSGVDDWWVVGGDRSTGEAQLAHIGPDGVRAPDIGALAPQLPAVLYKVWGAGGWLFVVGDEGTVLTRDPEGLWSLEHLGQAPLFTVHGTGPQDVWAVGGGATGEVWRWDGSSWSDARPPEGAGLSGVFADSSGDTWVSGTFGRMLHHDGGGWTEEDPATVQTLHAVWSDGAGGVWSVGGNVEETSDASWRGVVVKR
jgi:hypothetical protein